ncbi:IclR family transcriptional regulator C-terminal domain-containing protein [Acuticoccus sp. MNP-M23]|uniref:IclR family transcriptional regulator domain-containing protein n=1 Tax=Acuticoccus sp. MNP-M23 TaxID=3072793 RepID=UPI002814EDB4|nr:IclR family transcriptional regulator C-terminal domain-containing protein [Acuticoccus sp. MNP-M23]WMS44583.1 IclR family transcriptional regulator C-terminal domain-containing protein [Acuticoccus sp. MNP-M23]
MGRPLKQGEPPDPSRRSEFVEGLAKGLAVLECFDAENPAMNLSEVARRAGLSPSAARRSLITLSALGYIGQAGKTFHLKSKLLGLGSAVLLTARIEETLNPELRALVTRFGDASSVATLDGHDVIYVAHHSVQRARRRMAFAGARYPATATSLGRVILAGLPPHELDAFFATLTPAPLTEHTVVDKRRLREIIDETRQNDHAVSVDQLDYGITALAVPIRAPDGAVVAALNTSGYSGSVSPESLIGDRLEALRSAAAVIAQTLLRYPVLTNILRASTVIAPASTETESSERTP